MKTLIATLSLILLAGGNALATVQIPDILIYEGKTEPILRFTNPLESYFNEENPKPWNVFINICSANARGYFAIWEIKDNYLYLTKLLEDSCWENSPEITIFKVFPGQQLPIKATWFSGTLRIPHGKLLKQGMGYEPSIYEQDLIFTIEEGKVVSEKIINNTLPN